MTTAAVIPIKQLKNAKQRLAGLLSSDERMLLFTAMVEDVLTAVEACVQIDRIIVVTDDNQVAELALGYGAEIMAEPVPPGLIEAVTDREILEAYQFLAVREGIFVEPASAASVAGVLKRSKKGYFARGSTLVCVLTGHGLKDPELAVKTVRSPKVMPPKLGLILNEIGY